MTCGIVKAYDYDLSFTGDLQWDIEVSELWIVMWKEMVSGVYGNWKMKMYIDGQRLSDITFGGNVILQVHS